VQHRTAAERMKNMNKRKDRGRPLSVRQIGYRPFGLREVLYYLSGAAAGLLVQLLEK